jgi:hypothetical protein
MRARTLSVFALAALTLTAAEAQPPDLSGVWQRSGGRGGRDAVSQWSSGDLPFTAAGREHLNSNKPGKGPRAVPPAFGNDPMGGANPPGLYRTLVYNRPFEIIQVPGKVVQLFEWDRIHRIIWTDGRPVPEDVPAGPYWYGYSVGHWDGDTLVVTTIGLDSRAFMDEWGTPFSDGARFEERWKRTAPDKMEVTITVTDPETYSKPWTSIPITYTLHPETDIEEMIFAPIDEVEFNERIRDPAGGKTNE